MEQDQTKDRNYWHLLDAARAALDAGDFVTAERRFLAATAQRDASPGRVFLTESLGDGLARLLRGRGREAEKPAAGRWERESGAFTAAFMAAGEHAVREGVRLAELRPEDDAAANQPVLEAALFLVVRSRLFPEEFSSAVPLLKGLFRTAARTGRVFDVHLIRHEVPLTEEDRLWLARRGGDLLEIFAEQGRLVRGSGPAREWAAAVLQLLQPRYFGSSGRLAEERAWLEAVSADRLQGDAEASVRLYRAYLQTNPEPGPRADEARVRTLELLANIDAEHFPVPRYAEALGALQSAGLAAGSEQAGRYGTAVARIEYRRPEPDAGIVAAAWASAALGADGAVVVVLWWGSEPRDVARWSPGDGVEALDLFLAPCAGRIVARDVATLAAAGAAWPDPPATWPIGQWVEALAEPDLPRGGLDEETLRRLAAGEGGPWRSGWRRELGQPQLKPTEDWAADPRADTGLGRALLCGLVVLGLRNRIAGSDPSLRAGLAELARRGDAAAGALYDLLTAGDEAARAMDASFAAWTVPLLWTRPDPFNAPGQPSAAAETVKATRPDLGRNDVALVSTGDPAAVMAAWGGGHGRWRVVLDRMDRLAELAPASAGVIGPVTLIPPGGRVHRLDAALARLDSLVRRRPDPDDPTSGLLAVFHWVRVVCTHNGDLLDFQAVRPWLPGAFPLYDRYAAAIGDLPRHEPGSAAAAGGDGWDAQFGQRARKAGFVAGQAADLPGSAELLDGLWGVFEGSGASWVFLDTAVVHAQLAADGEATLAARHALLLQRGHRHLSLLTGSVWCREELQDLVAGWLGTYGSVYRLALTDLRCPPLILADRGPVPGGRRLEAEALAGALAHVVEEVATGGSRLVVLPPRERGAAFWRAAHGGRFGVPSEGWDLIEDASGGQAPGQTAVLVVPELAALAAPPPASAGGDAAGWRDADRRRARWAAEARRRCSLEIAGYLAGGWAAVEILDARWWRLLRDEAQGSEDAAGAPGADPWTGTRAAALAAAGRARCLDLPETAGDARRRLAPALVAEVAGWVAGRGAEAREPEPAAAWPAAGAHLAVGPPAPARRGLLAALGGAWERGRLDAWALLVSHEPWPEAAGLAAEAVVAGCSTWPADGKAPAPVLWVRPGELADERLIAYLATHRPTVAVVPDLPSWLPAPEHAAQGEATALRVLLGLGIPAVLLQTAALPPAWRGFLGAATGVTVSGPAHEPAPAAPAGRLPAAMLIARLRVLLGQLRPLVQQWRGSDDGGRQLSGLDGQLVPVTRLANLAGLTAGQVRDGLRLLRWAARLAGDPLSAAEDDGAAVQPAAARSHRVLVVARFAELETRLDLLGEALGLFLPLWLGRLPVGARTVIDLNQPPAQADPALLTLLDTWLLEGGAAGSGLVYKAPRGVLNSTRRRISISRPLPQVQETVHGNLDLFRRRLQDVMSAAVETGAGFLVDTGLEQLRPDELVFLALGDGLGFWRWCGPPGAQVLPLVDLLTIADSQTVQRGQDAWTLVGALGGAARPAAEPAPDRTAAGGRLRSLLGHGDADAHDDGAVGQVANLAGEGGEPTYLVLKGLAGSGRLDAVVAGLKRAADDADDPGEVTVFCPDPGAGAAVARRALGAGLLLDLRLPTAGDLPEPVAAPLPGPAGHQDVVVVLDVQRFAPEVRYRIAQHGRGRRLLLTVDPAASAESWENLFLTTPRTSDVRTMDEQHDQARRLWERVRTLVPAPLVGDAKTRRRERGELVAEYAANLDQCVARIVLGRSQGQLPSRLRLTAPLAADLDFLAGALRDQGWLAVDEAELDTLFLPGPCDLLAAAADLLAEAGLLREPGAPDEAGEAAEAEARPTACLLTAMPRDGTAAPCWPPQPLPDPAAMTLANLAALLLADPDLAPALVHGSARRRLESLLAHWGGRSLAELPREPLWQAWWVTLRTDLGHGDPAPDRPLVRLCPAACSPAVGVEGGVYLCLGGEDPRQHYRILSRITDTALVLYQDRSPLGAS